MTITTQTVELKGSSYEIGVKLARLLPEQLKKFLVSGFKGFDETQVKKAIELFDIWCPGLNEELKGFADTLKVPTKQIIYYGMTYLKPNCSQIALSSSITKNGHPMVARSYEFSHEAEDFTLVRTCVANKYTHLGTSVAQFGRDDGFNEHGLVVTMSSCGFPVGANENMRKSKIIGLQFWAVIRSLLENCKDVNEALDFVSQMPIAFNINLMLVDKSGNIALVETLDGHKAIKRISENEQFICATNHAIIPELIQYEPKAILHSLERYNWIQKQLNGAKDITDDFLKQMLLSKYPNGLCCHYYKDFFGTTKSMIIDPICGTIDLCWGGQSENGWNKYNINNHLEYEQKQIQISFDKFNPEISQFIPINN